MITLFLAWFMWLKHSFFFFSCFFWFAVRFPRNRKKPTCFWCTSIFLRPHQPRAMQNHNSRTVHLSHLSPPALEVPRGRPHACSWHCLLPNDTFPSCTLASWSCLGVTFAPDKCEARPAFPCSGHCFSMLQNNPEAPSPSFWTPCHTLAPTRTSCAFNILSHFKVTLGKELFQIYLFFSVPNLFSRIQAGL